MKSWGEARFFLPRFFGLPFKKSSAPSGRLSATPPKKMPFDLTRREGRRGLLSDPLTSFPLEDSEKRKFDWIIAEFQHSGLTGPNHGSNSTKARGSFQNHERRNCATYGHSIFATLESTSSLQRCVAILGFYACRRVISPSFAFDADAPPAQLPAGPSFALRAECVERPTSCLTKEPRNNKLSKFTSSGGWCNSIRRGRFREPSVPWRAPRRSL